MIGELEHVRPGFQHEIRYLDRFVETDDDLLIEFISANDAWCKQRYGHHHSEY